jgi:hypothetical protein
VSITDKAGRPALRTDVAAWMFRSIAALLIVAAVISCIPILSSPHLSWLAWPASILAPCVPLIYLSARRFRERRGSAFDDLPQFACKAAACLFIATAVVLSITADSWGPAVGPSFAAFLFAVSVQSVREFLAQVDFRVVLLAMLGAVAAVVAYTGLFWTNFYSLYSVLAFSHSNPFVSIAVEFGILLLPAAAIFFAITLLPLVAAETAIILTSGSFVYYELRVYYGLRLTNPSWYDCKVAIGTICLALGLAYVSWRRVRHRATRPATSK